MHNVFSESSCIFSLWNCQIIKFLLLLSGKTASVVMIIVQILFSLPLASLCSLAMDLTLKNIPMKLFKEEQEPALRSVLMMLISPSQFIFSEASSKFLEAVLPLGNECMEMLMSSLESNIPRNPTTSFYCVKIMTNLMMPLLSQ